MQKILYDYRKIHISSLENPQSETSTCKNQKKEEEPPNSFPAELDDGDCNQDCIFKNDSKSLDDQIATIDQIDFGDPPQIINEEKPKEVCQTVETVTEDRGEKLQVFREKELTSETDLENGMVAVKNVIESEIDNLPSDLCTTSAVDRTAPKGDECRVVDESGSPWDSHQTHGRERHDSSEADAFLGIGRTVETSTDTLVGEGSR